MSVPFSQSIWPAMLFLVMLAAAPARAASAKPEAVTTATSPALASESLPSKATTALLDELEKRHGSDKTIYAEFDQLRHDESMDEDIKSTGKLWFMRSPDRFRCDYANPQPMITIITEQKLSIYTKELNQVDQWAFESADEYQQNLDRFLLGFGAKTSDLVRRYEIHSSDDEAAPLADLKKDGLSADKFTLLVFTPKPALREQSPFTQLKVFIDKSTYLPHKIWFQDPQGNTMRIQLKKVEFGAPIDTSLFSTQQAFPAGVKTINKREAI